MSVCHIFPTTTKTSTPKLLLIISLLKESPYIFNNSKILLEIKWTKENMANSNIKKLNK